MEGEPGFGCHENRWPLGDRFRRRGQRQVSWRIYWTFGRRGLLRRNDHALAAEGRASLRVYLDLCREKGVEPFRGDRSRPPTTKSIEGCLQPLLLARSVFQRPRDSVCVARDRAKIRSRGLIRFGAALLPVTQRAERNMIATSELLLGQTKGATQRLRAWHSPRRSQFVGGHRPRVRIGRCGRRYLFLGHRTHRPLRKRSFRPVRKHFHDRLIGENSRGNNRLFHGAPPSGLK